MSVLIDNSSELLNKISDKLMNDSYAYIVCTDSVEWAEYSKDVVSNIEVDKLLELRVFNANGEVRITRPTIDSEFFVRELIDGCDIDETKCFDQWMHLDINGKSIKADTNKVSTINGGEYTLPVRPTENIQIMVRNYLAYEENGQVYIEDWRLVKFGEGDK